MTNQEWSESKEKIHFLFILRSTEERTRNEAIRNNSRQIRNWSRTKGRDMVGSSFMHSVPMHKFFQLRERIDFFPCFFPPFCSFFLYSFIYLFFFFLFFFLLLFYITPPFFRHTVKSYSIFDTGENDLHMIQRFFFFFSPLKRSTLKRESTIRIASQEWNSRLKNRLHTRLIVSPSFRRGLPSIYTLDSFLTCVPRNRPRNRCNYASRNLLFLIVDFSILSFHIVEKPRTNLKASFPYLLVGGQGRRPPFVRNSSRIHGSMIRRQEEISVWLPAPWLRLPYIHRPREIVNVPSYLIFRWIATFGRLTFFRATKRSNEENRVIFNTVDVLFKFGRIFHEYRS